MAGALIEITDSNFQTSVLQSQDMILIDFWAPWCGPCRAIAPAVEQLANEMQGKCRVGKVNVDDNQMVAGSFGVRSIPTLILFKGGKPIDQVVGAVPKAQLEALIKKHS